MSETSEMDYLMSEQKSRVMFVVEGKTIPALKSFLTHKSIVFSAMFSADSIESNEEIVIENTTYEQRSGIICLLFRLGVIFCYILL